MRARLEVKRLQRFVPGAIEQEAARLSRPLQIDLIGGQLEQIDECAGGISGNLGRNRLVAAADFRTIVTGNAA